MDLKKYFNEQTDAGSGATSIAFREAQASDFAKGVAGDFNPIHDPGSRRFCVPGDLLFSVLLQHYGTAEATSVQFAGMLDGKSAAALPSVSGNDIDIVDERDRPLIKLSFKGERIANQAFISALCEQYVKFSGQTFPDILVPLMRKANVMINPDRPMVIYQNMAISLHSGVAQRFSSDKPSASGPDPQGLQLQTADTSINVDGRKGTVRLQFTIELDGQVIGSGEKNMLLSGLREFDDSAMQSVIDEYTARRKRYQEKENAV